MYVDILHIKHSYNMNECTACYWTSFAEIILAPSSICCDSTRKFASTSAIFTVSTYSSPASSTKIDVKKNCQCRGRKNPVQRNTWSGMNKTRAAYGCP